MLLAARRAGRGGQAARRPRRRRPVRPRRAAHGGGRPPRPRAHRARRTRPRRPRRRHRRQPRQRQARVGFGSALLRERGLHLVGELQQSGRDRCSSRDEHGPVHLHALPFADPAEARAAYGDDTLHDQAGGADGRCRQGAGRRRAGERHVPSPTPSWPAPRERSERPISVGGASRCTGAGLRRLRLRGPRPPASPAAGRRRRRSATPAHSEVLVRRARPRQVGERGRDRRAGQRRRRRGRGRPRPRLRRDVWPLRPPHDVRRLEGTLAELLERGRTDPRRDDYVQAVSARPRRAPRPHRPAARGVPQHALHRAARCTRPSARAASVDRGRAPSATSSSSTPSSATSPPRHSTDDQRAVLGDVIDGLERRRREASP